MHRQGSPVPESTVTTQVHEPFDIHGDFRTKFPFYLVFAIDHFANAVDLSFGKIVCVGIGIDFELFEDPIGACSSNTVYIGQTDFYPFASR
jgi:hypothetical protein